MQTPFDRVFEAAGCRTQMELAALLGIQQSSISCAQKQGNIPAKWLLTLLRLRGVNPEWILHGTGSRYLVPQYPSCEVSIQDEAARHSMEESVLRTMLNCFSSRDLADELVRRTGLGHSLVHKPDQSAQVDAISQEI